MSKIPNYQEYSAMLKGRIGKLSYKRSLQLAIVLAKKLFFNYQTFFDNHQWGNPDLLMDGINTCEKALSGSNDPIAIKRLILQIEEITPDTEDFGDVDGSYALNASAVVCETLQFVLDNVPDHIFDCCDLYLDTVNFRIHEHGEIPEGEVDNHPIMMQARAFLMEQTM